MCEKQCNSCKFYLYHYTFNQRRIFRVYCGHCTFSKARHKRPDAKACDHYIPGQPREDAFVSKEYLSKELLQYMLRLEMLPEIENL